MHRRPRTPLLLGTAVAFTLGAGVTAPPAFAATDPDPVPGLVAGTGTAAPQLVTGVDEPAPGADDAEAARAHLAAHPDRYRVDPAQLVVAGVERSADGRRTIRFQQRHGGLPVFGSAYLVHLTGEGDARRVESVGGKYFTGLTAPATQAAQAVPDALLRDLALGTVAEGPARAGVTAVDRGQVVLPGGGGRLARHFTVRGTDPKAWEGRAREVYLDAGSGAVALSVASRTPGRTGSEPAATAGPEHATTGPERAATGPERAATAGLEPAVGTVPDVHGRPVPVNLARLPDGTYQLIDLTRPARLTVHDAGGRDEYEVGGPLPEGVGPVSSPTPDFPASLAATGAAEAQRNSAAVYDFFHDRLGRNGIDGKGGPIDAVVNVTRWGGESLPNAFWGSGRMTYGGGNAKFYPFAAALDVAGHEMTHGIVENTAELVLRGQSGALDEAIADYFGNAVEVTALGMPMTDPRAALLGESLCRTGTPEACAERRFDTGRSTVKDYVGFPVDFSEDSVHDNSDIMSGALWDIRRTLDPLVADRLVHRALTEYLTPLDTFVDARNAVLAAGRSMGLTRAQLRSVTAAFDAHGIKEGWERRIGMDSRTVLGPLTDGTANWPDVADGRWVMATGADGYLRVLTGRVGSSAEPVQLSPVGEQLSHGYPATDGTLAAWIAEGSTGSAPREWSVLVRPLDGGATRTVYGAPGRQVTEVRVAGRHIAFQALDFSTGRTLPWLSVDGAPAAPLALPDGHSGQSVSLRGDLLAFVERWQEGERTVYAPTVRSLSTGAVLARYVVGASGSEESEVARTLLTADRLLWLQTPSDRSRGTSIRSAALDGSGVTDLLTGSAADPRPISELTASERAVTFAHGFTWPKGRRVTNADLPKIWQLPIGGGTPQRYSCNRGGQYTPVADRGTRVLWADATAGRTDLVVRERPAVTC
ncbi:M4 family metallopeptidase [Kitasatospora sp. NPDC051853]|uniref:M4 family metallopeptidase n=1 Tax=Kitasatospora sp. NPDC051853 TaxID=3364058 RepID=UPI00379F374A